MYPPITCFCGRPLGHIYRAFQLMCAKHRDQHPGEPMGAIFDQLNIQLDCCRSHLMDAAEHKDYYNQHNPHNTIPTLFMGRGSS